MPSKLEGLNVRPCLVGNRKALFHTWEQFANVIAPAAMIGGHPGGQVAQVFAIVEYEDGTVSQEHASSIRFLDIAETFGVEENGKV